MAAVQGDKKSGRALAGCNFVAQDQIWYVCVCVYVCMYVFVCVYACICVCVSLYVFAAVQGDKKSGRALAGCNFVARDQIW